MMPRIRFYFGYTLDCEHLRQMAKKVKLIRSVDVYLSSIRLQLYARSSAPKADNSILRLSSFVP